MTKRTLSKIKNDNSNDDVEQKCKKQKTCKTDENKNNDEHNDIKTTEDDVEYYDAVNKKYPKRVVLKYPSGEIFVLHPERPQLASMHYAKKV